MSRCGAVYRPHKIKKKLADLISTQTRVRTKYGSQYWATCFSI